MILIFSQKSNDWMNMDDFTYSFVYFSIWYLSILLVSFFHLLEYCAKWVRFWILDPRPNPLEDWVKDPNPLGLGEASQHSWNGWPEAFLCQTIEARKALFCVSSTHLTTNYTHGRGALLTDILVGRATDLANWVPIGLGFSFPKILLRLNSNWGLDLNWVQEQYEPT